MNNTPIPTERKDRLRREAKGEAAYPRRDFWEELTSEDPFWSDLRRQYPDLDFEDLLQRHYKPRFLNVLDEQGKVLHRVNIRPEGLEEEEIQFFLQRFGFPYITLRLRLRRQGGAYYGIQTFQATHLGPPPRPPHLPAPVALAIQAPSPRRSSIMRRCTRPHPCHRSPSNRSCLCSATLSSQRRQRSARQSSS